MKLALRFIPASLCAVALAVMLALPVEAQVKAGEAKILVDPSDDELSKQTAAPLNYLAWSNGWDVDGLSVQTGSGVLVCNNESKGAWILTAKHAVVDERHDALFPRVVYGFNPDSFSEFAVGGYIEVANEGVDIKFHPTQDLALVRLASLARDENDNLIEPMEFYDQPLVENDIVFFGGFGYYGSPSEAGSGAIGNWDGIRRVARGRFDRYYILRPTVALLEYEAAIPLSGTIANSDSGGFASIEQGGVGGKLLLVGINVLILGTGEEAETGIEYLGADPNFQKWIDDAMSGQVAHSADQNGDRQINLSELLRVIQFYNSNGYHCVDVIDASEDGFLPGEDADRQTCKAHASDYEPQDWSLSLSELLRSIQFFNTGGYHACPEGEDGYCPGPLSG